MNTTSHSFEVAEDSPPQRIDQFLSASALGLSRSQIKARAVSVLLNGKEVKLSAECRRGDRVVVSLEEPEVMSIRPESIRIDTIFEDDNVIVVDKPSGLVVHPAAGNWSGTLVHGLLHRFADLRQNDFDDDSRPGIVHRLDKDTSGVMIVAKFARSHEFLSAQFQDRSTKKSYLCVVKGSHRFKNLTVDGFIRRDPRNRQLFAHDAKSGKAARTDFTMLSHAGDYALLLAQPLTGRTHQIRVHARDLQLPIVGDPLYARAGKNVAPRLMLHAWRLSIVIPGESSPRVFEAPLPDDLREICEVLKLSAGLEAQVLSSGASFKS